MTVLKVAVYGVGGVGGYFGAVLARAGNPVSLIARGEHLKAIRASGLRIQSPKEEFTVTPAAASDNPADIGPVDIVLVGVKAWQVPDAAKAIRPLLKPDTRVVPLQNGVEAVDQLAQVLGREHVLAGLCRVIASIAAPGVIKIGPMEPIVVLGEFDGSELAGNAGALYEAFRAAGVNVQKAPDIRAALWEKLLFIAAVSGVGSVSRANVGEVRQSPPTRALLQQVMEEVAAVADKRGVRLAPDIVARTLAFIDSMPGEGTASMQRDVAAGRPSELEAIIGSVNRLGSAAGVPTPATQFIYASLLPQEKRARSA
ncbi:MAG: 2-dehydropantoate 2-reductase [Terriglobales bacterium]|jgi:2-dehydropantoate 2-reductase